MRILVLCYEYPPIGGGGGVGAQQYAEAWAAKGHAVTVLTGRARGLPARARIRGVDVIRTWTIARMKRATSSFASMLGYLVFGGTFLLRHHREIGPYDIVNTHFSIPTGPLGRLAARAFHCPNVLTIIGGDIHDPTKSLSPHRIPVLRAVNRWVIDSADQIVAISSDTKERARRYYAVTRGIEVINYGFKPMAPPGADRRDLAPDPVAFRLIAIGRLVRRKGFEYLLEAMQSLPPEITLRIIGDGPLESRLRARVASLGLQHRVSLAGYLPREEIYAALRQADCFVLSSLHEGLGIVVQEAMEAGLPIVATDNGGQVDLIHPPRNGILVPPADASALARGIRALYDDRDRAREMGNHNRLDIQRLHIDGNSEEYIRIFQRLIDSPPKPAAVPARGVPG